MTVPPALTFVDILLLVVVIVGLAARAWVGIRVLRAAPAEDVPRVRRRMWGRAIATQWLLVAALIALWRWTGRPFSALQVVPRLGWGAAGVLVGLGFGVGIMLRQRRAVMQDPAVADAVRAKLGPVERLMPHEPGEWPQFALLAITAGVCEEVLFRGFVTWAFAQVLPAWWMAAVAQAVCFGLAHAYQGARGIFTTGAAGVVLTGVVFVSGSLWPAILMHALMDLNAGDLARRVWGGPPAAATS